MNGNNIKPQTTNGGWHISRTILKDGTLANEWDGTWDYAHSLGIHLCRLTILLPKTFERHQGWHELTTILQRPLRKKPALPPKRTAHLDRLLSLFNQARASNRSKFILRLYYEGGGDPPSLPYLLADVEQFVPVIRENSDVVLCIQAGFLGKNWGEWWGSAMAPDEDFGEDFAVETVKRELVGALIKAGVPVCLRYPRDIANYFCGNPNVGWHDDAILAQGSGGPDAGTFEKGGMLWQNNRLKEAQTFAQTKILGIRGGECCCDAGSVPSLRDLFEFVKEYRLSYLNAEYPDEIFRQFCEKGEMVQEITKELERNGGNM
ncbi:hypothetical protein HDU97_003596 [Phlyctochytrium planicorne]|nr:hypothetical protein HDU97_003596 [Phlyctochytrium planicorne]